MKSETAADQMCRQRF